jgi:hypothetical protein
MKNKKNFTIDVRSNNSLYIKFNNGNTIYVECSYATENKIFVSKFKEIKTYNFKNELIIF